MKIQYTLTKLLPWKEAALLYKEAGWFGEDEKDEEVAATLEKMLQGSFSCCCAFTEKGELIGLMRALSDGVSDAYILDLVVKKEFRKQGIGKKILTTLVEDLEKKGLDWIVCIGVPGTENFYPHGGGRKMTSYTPYRFGKEAEKES